MLDGPAQALATQRTNLIIPICSDLIDIEVQTRMHEGAQQAQTAICVLSKVEHADFNAKFRKKFVGGGARTHTALRPLDFESSASATSATPAIWNSEPTSAAAKLKRS